jgi:large subunit ribosomal protein L22
MTGPKLNEATNKVGVSSGTRAKAMNVRMSASKIRVVLNHVRGLQVQEADSLLSLIQRDSAHDIRKLLASAVANAVNNDSKVAEDLYVKA